MIISIEHEGSRISVAGEVHAAGVNGGYIVTARVPISGAQGHFRSIRIGGVYLTYDAADAKLQELACPQYGR